MSPGDGCSNGACRALRNESLETGGGVLAPADAIAELVRRGREELESAGISVPAAGTGGNVET